MRHQLPISVLALALALAASPAVALKPPVQEESEGLAGVYSFVGALEGDATLFAARSGAQTELELHLPILRGDRIWTTPNARLAVLLSDRSTLTLDHDSELTLDRIAGSPDGEDQNSLYVLHRGRLGLAVEGHQLESTLPVVDTANARVYVKQDGRYQIHSDGSHQTEVSVFAGFAEVVTQRGSVIVRGGETLVAAGIDNPWIDFRNGVSLAAAALDEWTAEHRTGLAAYAAVDADGYRGALDGHGEWVEVDDGRAWKPRVERNWQPYSRGRWTDTPAGLYWVARDPWGPLTYHYGSWNRHPAWGWLWYPGLVYAPSHVYWYWGPSYVGWIPRGYYQHHYRRLGHGLRFGLYGWAGGYWDPFNTWIFCPTGYLGYGRGYAYGRSLRRRHSKLERGIITTDTRGIDRRNWRDPAATQRVLIGLRNQRDASEIPSADDFVARRPDLDRSFRREVRRAAADVAAASVRGLRPAGQGAGVRSSGVTRIPSGGVQAEGSEAARARLREGIAEAGVRRSAPVPAARGGEPAKPEVSVRKAPPVAQGSETARARLREGVAEAGVRRSAPAPAAQGDGEPAKPNVSVRKAPPAAPGAAPEPSRRPTAGRRVLDAIRGRDGGSSPVRVRPAPRSSPPRGSAPPRATSSPPRVRSTPRSAPPPRSTPPRSTSSPPRVRSTPRSAPPPRSTPPRSTSSPPRVRSTPRSAAPPRSTPPRSTSPPSRVRSTPRSAPPPRSTPPRSTSPPSRVRSAPRSSPPSRSTPPKSTAPSSRVRSTPRSSPPPRSTSPPSRVRSAPRSSTPSRSASPPSRVRSTPRSSPPRSSSASRPSSRPSSVRSSSGSSSSRSSSPPPSSSRSSRSSGGGRTPPSVF